MLNLIKKMTAVIVVVIVTLKVLIFDTFALSVAPVGIQFLIEAFGALLVSSGMYTQEQVNDMSWGEVQTNVESGISSGLISTSDIIIDGQLWLNNQSFTNSAVIDVVDTALDVWFETLTEEDVVCTPVTDMQGFGCKVVAYSSTGNMFVYLGDYAVVSYDHELDYIAIYSNDGLDTCEYRLYASSAADTYISQYSSSWAISYSADVELYGDVRHYLDGSQAPTDDETVAEVGETADGEKVTLDDIQSGAVSLDDTTVDYDAFDDDAILDLLQQILTELEQVPVVEENSATVDSSKETVADMAAELDIAELNNLQMPLGILDVFPFCLPFDFVRGMELLVAKPEVPVFTTVIDFGEINGWDLGEYPVEISFEKWEPVAVVTRWTSLLLFSYVLIFISTKIVKGAGA